MILVIVVAAFAFIVALTISGNLSRIASALEAQNAHYGIGSEPKDEAAA